MRKRYLFSASVALAMVFIWSDAQAQWFQLPSGPGAFYVGVEGGYTGAEDAHGHVVGGPGTGFNQRFSDGYNVGARVGYEWGPWRFEEEYRYQENGQNGLTLTNVPAIPALGFPGGNVTPATTRALGDRHANAIMTNAIYDFSGWNWLGPVTPHIGVGIGAVELNDKVQLACCGTLSNNSQWEFGYQAIAGLRYNINPAIALDLDYRYLATTDPTFRSNLGFSRTSEYSTNSLVASLTYRFGPPPVVAPPAPPPPPPPVTRRVFLVFFDWDRDTITPDGMRIVQQAADAFRSGAPVQIQVTGYTDASGSVGYNQRLSERRANNVANALARFGVARQAMVVSGRGKNDQRVPTADGVREPQNRRVEIVFP
jgi:OmpA-OmpF porin, OOP family